MPKKQQKGEKQIKKSVSKKKDSKPSKIETQPVEKQTNVKSPPTRNRPSSVKKDVRKVSKKKDLPPKEVQLNLPKKPKD